MKIEIGLKEGIRDFRAESLMAEVKDVLGKDIFVDVRTIYLVDADIPEDTLSAAVPEIFADPVIQKFSPGRLPAAPFDFAVTVCYKPGVTDNTGKTAGAILQEFSGYMFKPEEGVHTAQQYMISGVDREETVKIAQTILSNALIEDAIIQSYEEWQEKGTMLPDYRVFHEVEPRVESVDLEISDEELIKLSKKRMLALNLEEMQVIRNYFRRKDVKALRKKHNLSEKPTDVELEVLAQTWSEHCHHKIFNAKINYTGPDGKKEIDSLFDEYIKKVTKEINSPWLLSVFKDNAGVIQFDEDMALVYKVETHNSPSALDPFGGAMTGIVGVNRDPMGTGLGAELTANVWGYCLGNPEYKGDIPAGLMHPKRIREGVHRGVIEGGNQSGIPMMRGFEVFDDRFMGKPLVFCGTLGQMPLEINEKKCYEKEILPGDCIVMSGGKVGKDGIHGATFSSEELHSGSPVQAVQIGDPITQKKLYDMMLEARKRGLYRAVTDNGAGGLSSSIGEMSQMSGGCCIDLSKIPLKYQGLLPWEILVSEAQERMSYAVDPKLLDEYLKLSDTRDVDSTHIGTFTDSGMFQAVYGEKTVALLHMDFLHNGDPGYVLEGNFNQKQYDEPDINENDYSEYIAAMMSRLNLCSGEEKIRQYDHEVKGRSVIKPLCGKNADMYSDAAVMLADYNKKAGIMLTEALNPFYSDIDTYWMAAHAVALALCRIAASGGDITYVAGLDNFCWPNVVKDTMPERSHKLAQLVRANQGLYDFCKAFRIPLISGKDSMFNDCTLFDPPVSIPPTLLFSVVSRIDDVRKSVTPAPGKCGEVLYIIGKTEAELGGSEFYRYYGEKERNRPYIGNCVPKTDADAVWRACQAVNQAAGKGLITACHALHMGGIAAGICRMAIAGDCGITCNTDKGFEGLQHHEILFSESIGRFIAAVLPENTGEFESLFKDVPIIRFGEVVNDRRVKFVNAGKIIADVLTDDVRNRFQQTLSGHRR